MYDDTQEREDLGRRTREREKRARERARQHPIRVEILDLYAQDKDLPLTAKALLPLLKADTILSSVAYHLNVLKEARLIPARVLPV